MAQITISGTIVDPSGTVPDSGGTIEFLLNSHFKRADGKIAVPRVEIASLNAASEELSNGAFSLILESTRDGIPSTCFYRVTVKAKFGGVPVNYELGKVQIQSTPSAQVLEDLLIDALVSETTGRRWRDWSGTASTNLGHIAGTIDGSNRIFTLSKMLLPNSEMGFINEYYQVPGVSYSINGNILTFVEGAQPLEGDSVNFSYDLA